MSKSGSRYGRRSNWFKQYFQENEQRRQIDDVKSTNETDDKNIVMEHRYRRPSTSPSTKDHHRPLSKVNGSSDTIRFVTPKIYPDLVLSTPAMSSHFYANYFPHLANFSRFLTSPLSPSFNGRDSRFFLNTDCEPMSLFNGFDFRNPVSECYENTIRLTNIKCDDQELPLSRTRADDPLDLSSNSRSGIGGEQEARRTMPLDLSVKWADWIGRWICKTRLPGRYLHVIQIIIYSLAVMTFVNRHCNPGYSWLQSNYFFFHTKYRIVCELHVL